MDLRKAEGGRDKVSFNTAPNKFHVKILNANRHTAQSFVYMLLSVGLYVEMEHLLDVETIFGVLAEPWDAVSV